MSAAVCADKPSIDDDTLQQLCFYHRAIFRIGNSFLAQYREGETEASRADYNAQRDSVAGLLSQPQNIMLQITATRK